MNKDINLLGRAKRRENNIQVRLKILRLVAISLLFLVSVCSVVLFILISFSPLPELRQSEQTALAEIAVHHPRIAQMLFLQERLNSIQSALETRQTFSEAIAIVQSELPATITVESAEMIKKTLRVTVAADSLSPLDTFLNSMMRKTQEKAITSLQLNELGLNDQTGRFELAFEVELL